jgi:N-acetylmuramoyl-L-alanine amidase
LRRATEFRPVKFLPAILLALAVFAAPLAAAPKASAGIEHITVAGRDCVQVQDWAEAHRLNFRWLIKFKTLELSDGTNRLELTLNSAQAEFNGVKIWCAHPVLMRDGRLYFTQFDLQNTYEPLLLAAVVAPGKKLKIIALDPGHGGKDTGNRIYFQSEKTHTLLLAQEIRDLLKKSGIKVVFTRTGDSFVELNDRSDKAEKLGADLFISLHYNASVEDRNSVQGTEVYCLTPAGASSTNAKGVGAESPWTLGNRNNARSLNLAYQIQHSLIRNLAVNDRGVRRARFAVLREAAMPAILIEAGFMTHPVEGKKIFTAAYRRSLARAIANGIVAYERAEVR